MFFDIIDIITDVLKIYKFALFLRYCSEKKKSDIFDDAPTLYMIQVVNMVSECAVPDEYNRNIYKFRNFTIRKYTIRK